MKAPAVVLCALLFWSGCSKCGANGPGGAASRSSGLLELLPQGSVLFVVNDLGAFGQKLKRLEQLKVLSFVAQTQGFGSTEELFTAAFGALGVDPRSDKAMREAGIAPERGMGAVVDDAEHSFVVLGVEDAGKLTAFVESQARNRRGASVRTTQAENGLSVVTFARPQETRPQLGLVILGKYAILGGLMDARGLRAAAGLRPESSAARAPALVAALKRLPTQRDLFAFVPQAVSKFGNLAAPVTASVVLDASGLNVQADLPAAVTGDLSWLKGVSSSPRLLRLLPDDAFVRIRFDGSPARAFPAWQKLVGPRLEALVRDAGIDVQKDLLDNLRPGGVASLSLSPTASVGAGLPALDVRQTNPFQYVQLVGLGELLRPEPWDQLLEKLTAAGPALGMTVKRASVDGTPSFHTSYARGEGVSLSRVKNLALIAAPASRLESTLRQVSAAVPAPSRGTELPPGPLALRVDFLKLADEVRALPPEAWGVGGFAIRAAAVRWLDVLSDVKSLDVSAAPLEDALEVNVALQVTTP